MNKKVQCFFISIIVIGFISCRNKNSTSSELLFWCSNNNQEIKFSSLLKDNWNKDHPDALVHVQPIPEGQSSEEVILAAVVGKSTPDVYANMWQGNVEMYANAHVLIPLDTISGFLSFIKDRCDSNVIKEITSADGHVYQVPWKVNPIMTIYNKDAFISNNINGLPLTYAAYLNAASNYKLNNRYAKVPKRFGYTDVKPIWYQRLFNFYPLYIAASDGAPLITNNKAAFNNKNAIEVFKFLRALYANDYFSKENTAASTDPFVVGNIVTKWTGPWEIAYLNNIPARSFRFGYFPPVVPDGHIGPVHTYADPKNMVIFNTCKDPTAAWTFIRSMIDKNGDLQLLQITGQLPRRKCIDTDPFYKPYFDENPLMLPFAKEIPYVKGIDNCEVIVEALDIISQEYEACVIYGKKSPEQAISDAASDVNILLGKEKNK